MKIWTYFKTEITLPRWAVVLPKVLISVLVILFGRQYYFNSMMQTTIQELSMQKGTLIRQIDDNDKKRSALQKSLWEAINKGLNSNEETKKLHLKDETLIENTVNDANADANERLFKRKFGAIRQLPNKKQR